MPDIAFAVGVLIGALVAMALPLTGGILLLRQGNKRRGLAREHYQQTAMSAGQLPSVNPEAEKAGRGLRVTGIILIAFGCLMVMGNLARIANPGV
ncbi:MAG: hypothetical protein ACK5LN_06300 [Propioniciclava sp.]